MKNYILALLISCPIFTLAQTHEFGLQLGASNYLGDLAPSIALSETHEHLALFYRNNRANGFISWKYALSYGKISGNDANFQANVPRNLDFISNILEGSLQLEFNFQKFFIGLRSENMSPYVFTGLGLAHFNPKGSLNGTYYNLRQYSTEGQGIGGAKVYSNFTVVIPFGGGIKWVLNKRFNIAAVAEFRFAYTDYLDDVSGTYFDNASIFEKKGEIAAALADKSLTKYGYDGKERGNPDRNDWYCFTGVSLSYWLLDRNCFNFK